MDHVSTPHQIMLNLKMEGVPLGIGTTLCVWPALITGFSILMEFV